MDMWIFERSFPIVKVFIKKDIGVFADVLCYTI